MAGLAALVKQRFPDYSPEQIAAFLRNHAEPRGTVPNNTWGYGFAKLLASDASEPDANPGAHSHSRSNGVTGANSNGGTFPDTSF